MYILRIRTLKAIKNYVVPVFQFLAMIGILTGMLVMFGGFGTWDYYDAIGEVITTEEDMMVYKTILCGIGTMIASLLVSLFCTRLKDYIDEVIVYKRKMLKRARRESVMWAVGDYIFENNIQVNGDNEFYHYAYGSLAKKRRHAV